MPEYNGSPWRSRFLRSPKIGLELAARPDFVALGDPAISTVRLGLKSGADSYFFVQAVGRPQGARIPVEGLGGWTGNLPLADLLPSIQTPKDYDTPRGRLAAVPTRRNGRYSGHTYYFSPRPGRIDRAVRAYIDYGEQRNVNAGTLVQANADETGWFRQTRNLVQSRWALPYNSGYDYGAIDNAIGAVLNGRLVGVEPAKGIDPDVLGGILNSTFTTLMRLLEGVATGNEGAFDVGPPAARVTRIPDPRKMNADGLSKVADVMRGIVADGVLPHAPLADATVPDRRQELDTEVLKALGMTAGEAASLLDRVYRSYARWRTAVEAVEDQMQANRRALARRGGSRNTNPARRAAATVWAEMEPATPLLLGDVTNGPYDILDVQPLPEDTAQRTALFGETLVLSLDGTQLDLGDERRVELVRFLRTLIPTGSLPLPTDPARCERLLTEATTALATFTTEAARRASAHVSEDDLDHVITAVTRAWTNASVTAIRATIEATAPSSDLPNGTDPSLFHTDGMVPPAPSPGSKTKPARRNRK